MNLVRIMEVIGETRMIIGAMMKMKITQTIFLMTMKVNPKKRRIPIKFLKTQSGKNK